MGVGRLEQVLDHASVIQRSGKSLAETLCWHLSQKSRLVAKAADTGQGLHQRTAISEALDAVLSLLKLDHALHGMNSRRQCADSPPN
jgi:hypothetical protein